VVQGRCGSWFPGVCGCVGGVERGLGLGGLCVCLVECGCGFMVCMGCFGV